MNKPATFTSLLIESAKPDIYRRNSFRVLNLNVRSTASEIKKYFREMEMEQNFGNRESASKSLDAEIVAEAKERLENIELRFIDEFFASWTNRGAHTEDSVFAMHDSAVMFHSLALEIETSANHFFLDKSDLERVRDDYWRKAINAWQEVYCEVGIWHQLNLRVKEMDDPRVTEKTVHELRQTLPLFLLMINARLAVQTSQRKETSDVRRHVGIMKEFAFKSDFFTQAIQLATEPLYNRINDLCKELELEASSAPEQADQAVQRLLERAFPMLLAIDDLLPTEDQKGNSAFDTLAYTVDVALVRKWHTIPPSATSDLENLQRYFERIARFARTPSLREMINGNIDVVKGQVQNSKLAGNIITPVADGADENKVQNSVAAGCWFCPKPEADSASATSIRLYKQEMHNQWFHQDIWVPRCANCQAIHDWVESDSIGVGVGGVTIVVVIIAAILTYWQEIFSFMVEGNIGVQLKLVILILSFYVLVGLYWVGEYFYRRALSKMFYGTKPLSYKKSFPKIKEAHGQGWSSNLPTN